MFGAFTVISLNAVCHAFSVSMKDPRRVPTTAFRLRKNCYRFLSWTAAGSVVCHKLHALVLAPVRA